ncbi:hypothetical protein D9M68_594660 [compost metagenome]
MKGRVFIIAFMGIFFALSKATPQIVKNIGSKVSVVAPPDDDVIPTCLDKLNSRLESGLKLWETMLDVCNALRDNNPSDVAAFTECQILANDTHTAMVQADLSSFYRCTGQQP